MSENISEPILPEPDAEHSPIDGHGDYPFVQSQRLFDQLIAGQEASSDDFTGRLG
jgi:hypothetical protein